MCSISSLRSFPNIAFEKVQIYVWLMLALSRPTVQDGTYVLGKAHIRLPHLSEVSPKLPLMPIFVGLTMALSLHLKEECWVCPLCLPLSSFALCLHLVTSSSALHGFTIKQNMNIQRLDFIWEKISPKQTTEISSKIKRVSFRHF